MKNFWSSFLKPKGASAKWLVFLSIVIVLGLGAMGYLDIVKEYTDTKALSYKFGSYEVSLYKALQSIFVVIFVFWVAAIFSDVAEGRILKVRKMRASSRSLILKLVQILIYFIAFILSLDIIGIDLTTLTVFSGALGIGLGFGLQKISSNFISGLILLMEKSVEESDLVELSDGTFGFIRRVSARFTLVETFDGKEILVPNEDFITSRVVNWTYSNPKARIEIPVGVSYKSDLEKVHSLILEAAKEHPRCANDPEPICYLRGFGDSSVNFILHLWVDDVVLGRWLPQSEIMFAIWRKFAENDIEIPFPQRDLHLKTPEAIKIASAADLKKKTDKKAGKKGAVKPKEKKD